MEQPTYHPISCSLHDELLALATLQQTIQITWYDFDGSKHQANEKIIDVFSRNAQEFLQLSSGKEIRLDQLVNVDGKSFGKDC